MGYFKLDAVKLANKECEEHFRSLIHAVLEKTAGKVTFDLDVTAGLRPGYFALLEAGPIFVENRYTDLHRYWPHQTLRNLWKLSHYVDPLRLRMEFLNSTRNRQIYQDDPLAPGGYREDYLFATTMFANPLGWFETSGLPETSVQRVAAIAKIWKDERAAIFSGTILPIGETPDGASWTGFASVAHDGKSGHILLFRETNDSPGFSMKLPEGLNGEFRVSKLYGDGILELQDGCLIAEIADQRQFLFARIDKVP